MQKVARARRGENNYDDEDDDGDDGCGGRSRRQSSHSGKKSLPRNSGYVRVETYEELHGGQFFLCGTRETLRIRGATQYAFIAVPCPGLCASGMRRGHAPSCMRRARGRLHRCVHAGPLSPMADCDPFESPLSGTIQRAPISRGTRHFRLTGRSARTPLRDARGPSGGPPARGPPRLPSRPLLPLSPLLPQPSPTNILNSLTRLTW